MLAICSDLDETPDKSTYLETSRYLNTFETTSMGSGVGLEVGNTIYFDMPPGQFSYWNTDDAGREMIRTLIRSGHIDCLHSYGDLAFTRRHAEIALNEFSRHDCRLEVWIDHAVAPTNFGGDIMQGAGDVPGHDAYHADLTCDAGIEYVWRGRVTSVIGQDTQRHLAGLFTPRHPIESGVTLAKEFAKGVLANIGNEKYAMHGSNEVLRKAQLRNGRCVYEFLRSNPHWRGVSKGDNPEGIPDVLGENFLDHLVDCQGVCILYTHLGKIRHEPGKEIFGNKTRAALKLLARYSQEGKVLVATTRRLLGYARAIRNAIVSHHMDGDWLAVDMTIDSDIDGLTVYVPAPDRTRINVNGQDILNIIQNRPDHTGRGSVSIPWKPLVFPKI